MTNVLSTVCFNKIGFIHTWHLQNSDLQSMFWRTAHTGTSELNLTAAVNDIFLQQFT
jgi:hypothetical protein